MHAMGRESRGGGASLVVVVLVLFWPLASAVTPKRVAVGSCDGIWTDACSLPGS